MHNGILLRHKKIKSADGIMLSEISQIEKTNIVWSHLYEESKQTNEKPNS